MQLVAGKDSLAITARFYLQTYGQWKKNKFWENELYKIFGAVLSFELYCKLNAITQKETLSCRPQGWSVRPHITEKPCPPKTTDMDQKP